MWQNFQLFQLVSKKINLLQFGNPIKLKKIFYLVIEKILFFRIVKKLLIVYSKWVLVDDYTKSLQ